MDVVFFLFRACLLVFIFVILCFPSSHFDMKMVFKSQIYSDLH